MTTDKPTVEGIRERHQIALFAFKHMAMPQSATDIGVLLAEIERLKAENNQLRKGETK